jgi:hypothetical protein
LLFTIAFGYHPLSRRAIKKCGRNPYKIDSGNLTLQLFLETELMSLPIEHKQYQLGRAQNRCIGEQCQAVVIRSYDRHFPPYCEEYESDMPKWEASWRKYANSGTLPCQETLHSPEHWKNPPNGVGVGSKFVEPAEAHEQRDLWDGLLVDGVPIALWVRQPADPKNDHPIMQAIIDKCLLADLSSRISKHRFENLPNEHNEAERIKKSPFCLLLDNPFRPFTYSSLESSHAQIQPS